MKKLYLATICFLPPLCVVLYPAVFLFHFPFPVAVFPYLAGYLWIGLIVLLIDLWRSRLQTEKKVLWTVLNLVLGLIALPIYWFLVLQKTPNQVQPGARANGRKRPWLTLNDRRKSDRP